MNRQSGSPRWTVFATGWQAGNAANWLSRFEARIIWRAIRDDFLNIFRDKECRELAERVG